MFEHFKLTLSSCLVVVAGIVVVVIVDLTSYETETDSKRIKQLIKKCRNLIKSSRRIYFTLTLYLSFPILFDSSHCAVDMLSTQTTLLISPLTWNHCACTDYLSRDFDDLTEKFSYFPRTLLIWSKHNKTKLLDKVIYRRSSWPTFKINQLCILNWSSVWLISFLNLSVKVN